MVTVKAFSKTDCYEFVVTDESTVTEDYTGDTYTYQFVKTPPAGVTTQQYLQNCKNESLALAQWEIDKKKPPEELDI